VNKKDKKVFVGVSGGVDSSVSAVLLKEEGYDVVGVFIKVWQPEFIKCDWEKERTDAMRVCAKLDIPFITLDLEDEYKKEVADYMILEYKKGRTPNPDVMCNKYIKFGSFLSFAKEKGADYIATGHYAQVKENNGSFKMYKGVDSDKDQSYFLWTLTQNELGSVLFPVGGYKKDMVRRLAKKYDLFTADKKDSQGICFLGHVDIEKFLGHYLNLKKGNIYNVKGEIVGEHNGAELYTIGQRHGFIITEKTPERGIYYVVSKNIEENTITVSHIPNEENFNKKEVQIESINWITKEPDLDTEYSARVRHRGELYSCKIKGDFVVFKTPQHGIAKGQSLVIYSQKECIGGGIVS
jgi:tRNA-specific 2-thiouridylase